ncbi:MAG: hypothetical protein K2Q18_03460, partial [Bdellovibrionales bacterium]|nr:hypothetical protein [Bdellovibrionales bacterium]
STIPANKDAMSGSVANQSGPGNVIDLGAGGGDAFKLDFKDSGMGDLAMANTGAGSAAAPEYEMNVNDIGKEDGPSIFEVISNRYLKSGYPKLLEVESTPKK